MAQPLESRRRSTHPRRTPRVCPLAGVLALAVAAACGQEAPDRQPLDETQRLAGLGQVWGLLNYYHPRVADRGDWDAVLLSSIPRVQAAATRGAFNSEIRALVDEAGSLSNSPGDPGRDPQLAWIEDASLFLPETSRELRRVVGAPRSGSNRYVGPAGSVRNPDFTGDRGYASAPEYPDAPTRLLALFRFWNMVQYYFPCRDLMDRGWREVLPELIPRFAAAADALDYQLAVAEMTASINDGHAATRSRVLDGYFGLRRVPLDFRLVENRTVIRRVFPRLYDQAYDLRVGDIVTHIDGVTTEARRAALRPVLPGSNLTTLERNVHDTLQRTNGPRLSLTVEGQDGRSATWDVNTVGLDAPWNDMIATHGEVSGILPGNVGYVHMGWLRPADVPQVMAQLRGTRAIVFDVRNYPNNTYPELTSYLNPTGRPFAKFQEVDYANPGRLVWGPTSTTCPCGGGGPPAAFTYTGRVVILCDEETISHAEFTVMALRTAPDATVIGSQTAGADGNVSSIGLPGGITTRFTGLGVFYPDGAPTQRIGIVPDLVVRPTISGLREGRDEVLEAALAFLD